LIQKNSEGRQQKIKVKSILFTQELKDLIQIFFTFFDEGETNYLVVELKVQ